MRPLFLIAILCLLLPARFFSQVGPPELRCLAVGPNGDVTLTWIAPADPGNVFSAYEIWHSPASQNGTYNLVATISNILTTTFLHAGAAADVQSGYYFMRCKYGPGGTIFSGNSDTLRSLFVNITTITDAINLKYNQLHQPRLATTSSSFTVLKEYPLGTWNTLGTTTDINYPHVISVCQASMGFQVTQLDGSGCLSTSNIQRGFFYDTKNPDETAIDSISVLPNGNVIISWFIPPDQDVVQYCIYQISTFSNVPVDTVKGRNSVSYLFSTTAANSGTVGLSVAAIDSCIKAGPFTSQPSTMFLTAAYNRCAYRTTLSWNEYPNMRNGVKEYRIYCSVDGGNFDVIGTTSNLSFIHEQVPPKKNLCYYVRAVNNGPGPQVTSSSNQTCLFSSEVAVPQFVYMRSASITDQNTARLKLFLDTSEVCRGIDIYRSANGVDFEPAGFVATGPSPHYEFNDTEVAPNSSSYYYRAVIKDSCGNARTQSNTCRTILLKVREDKELMFIKHLSWNGYEGFAGGLNGYAIYRVVNDEPSPQPIGTTGVLTSSFTDNLENEAANGSKIAYLVEAVEGSSNPYGFLERSQSNRPPVYMEGRIFVPSAFAPAGSNKVWLPVSHFIDKQEYRVLVFNRWGSKVFETTDDTQGWRGEDAPTGVYTYKISYKNSRGEYSELVGTVYLYR